ncbi:MAG TPA: hypothetical protein VNO51_05150, partial [Ilumatobacteraceae bacterium]|nr:hypothetical protein [Ilumatobacteraceae bacterium]
AIDAAGNVDLTPATHAWTVDTTPPVTAITAAPSDPTRGSDATLEFAADEAATFACALDGAAFTACSSPMTYSGLVDGRHTFAVVATDAAGNADPSPASVAWTVDTTPPDASITSAPNSLTNQATATFELGADEAGVAFSCSLDGGAYEPCAVSTTHVGLTDGPHTFAAVATDAAGNTDASPAAHAWSIDTIAPDTTLGSRPASPTNSTAASFTFSADEPGSFECALDEAVFDACANPVSYDGLSAGDHVFRVRAIDAAGNTDASPAAHAWTVDLSPPDTTIGSGPAGTTPSASATFEFAASEPGSTFACALDGAAVETCVSPQSYAGLADGAHTFTVSATDAANNVDESPASRTWSVDTVPPETSITSGPDPITNRTTAAFTVTADESASFACALDGGPFVPCAPETHYADLAEGGHSLSVFATDLAGNADASPATYAWTVDLTPPDTILGDRPSDPDNSAAATFTFTGVDETSDAGTVTFTCALDDGAPASCSSPATRDGLTEGQHTLVVVATDSAGNSDPSPASHAWTVDLTPPQTTIGAGPAEITNQSTATFALDADELGVTFACSLDEAAFALCDSATTYIGLADGVHTLVVRATDPAGNTDATPASRTWTIDTVAPETTLGARPPDPSNAASASFTFTADEPGSFECSLGTATFEPCESPASLTGLAEGAQTFAVRAIDAAGNADASPAGHA